MNSARSARRRPYRRASIKQPTWQNPLIEYWDALGRRRTKRRETSRRVRMERRILVMLAFFSISAGLWENFRQLWLQSNTFSVTDVSNVISFGMVLSVVAVLLVGKFVKMPRIKNLMLGVLIFRTANLFFLFLLNGTNLVALINILSALDVVAGCIIVTSVYPMLTIVMKSNRAYSRRKLVEYFFRDIGILIGGIFIGRTIGTVVVNYNFCLLISIIFSIVASVIMSHIELTLTERAPADKFSVVKYILRTRIQRWYMLYALMAAIAWNMIVGLRMLILTDFFSLPASAATNYLLIVGLSADILGVLALKYFTPKNDYVTISIKFGARLLIFIGAFLSGDDFICFLALTWALLSGTAYENITDGYYINSVDNRHQLKYNTIKYVVSYTGEAIGIFICGQLFSLGAPYIFGVSAFILVLQIAIAFYLIHLRRTSKH